MNTHILPLASVWLVASADISTPPMGWIDVLTRYGLPTLLLGALGWFTLWQEKQRNKRDEANRIEREKDKDALISELRESKKEIAEVRKWMMDKIDNTKQS